MKNIIATTKNGQEVYVGEETLKHLEAHSDVKMEDVKEAIGKISSYNGHFFIGEVNLGRILGKDTCVETDQGENSGVQYLYRKGRDGRTPVILGGEGVDTEKIVVGICLDDDGLHTLFTAFYGCLAPKEPWDASLMDTEKEESVRFWSTHALAVSEDTIDWERSK